MTITEETFKAEDIKLNWDLAQTNGLTNGEMQAIIDCHTRRIVIFDLMKKTDDREELRDFADEIEQLEYEMQAYWHFPRDRDYHTWWLVVPKCNCPKMDNRDPMYFGRRIIVGSCPVHNLGE